MKEFFHGGQVHKEGYKPSDFIDVSSNINPFGCSPKGFAALEEAIGDICHYPDPHYKKLLAKAASVYGIEEAYILPTNGAMEAIYALASLYDHKQSLVLGPSFGEYEAASRAFNLTCTSLSARRGYEFGVPPELVKACKEAKDTLIFLGHPNNPDGHALPEGTMETLLEVLHGSNLLVIDESFMDFTDGLVSHRELVKKHDKLVVIQSMTKFYAIPGLRLGLTFAGKAMMAKLKKRIPIWSVNHLAQAYMIGAFEDTAYREHTKKFYKKEIPRAYTLYKELYESMKDKGVHLIPIRGTANFMLFSSVGVTVEALANHLEASNILIRSCHNFDYLPGQWFRIAIKDGPTNDRLFEKIRDFYDKSQSRILNQK